jgi:hypothetical protein
MMVRIQNLKIASEMLFVHIVQRDDQNEILLTYSRCFLETSLSI